MFEKKRGKRFLASVMALVMLLSLAPVGALAANNEPPTNEECSTMPLPANEDNPKPVVTDEENTENTNEELTPPAMRVIQERLLITMILPQRFPKCP